jgi:hypothetical protein
MTTGFWDPVEPELHFGTTLTSRLDRLPVRAGDTCAGVYASPGWLTAMERISPEVTRYVVATDGERVLGVLPVYLLDEAGAGHYHPALAFGNTDGLSGPVAVLGGRAGYLTGWLLSSDADARAVLGSLLRAADDVATAHGAGVLTAQYLPPAAAAVLAQTGLVQPDEVIAHSAHVTVELPGTGFDDYLDLLSARRRSTVRRDLARFAASGLRLDTCRLSEALAFAPRMLAAVMARRGGQPNEDRMRSALEAQIATLDDVSTVAVASTASGQPVAYSLSYRHNDTLFVRLAGLDHDRAQTAAAYFVTTYYEPVRVAYRLGLSKVHIGIASYRPKVLRGGALSPLYGVLRRPARVPLSAPEREAVSVWLLGNLQHDLGAALTPPADMFAPVDWCLPPE